MRVWVDGRRDVVRAYLDLLAELDVAMAERDDARRALDALGYDVGDARSQNATKRDACSSPRVWPNGDRVPLSAQYTLTAALTTADTDRPVSFATASSSRQWAGVESHPDYACPGHIRQARPAASPRRRKDRERRFVRHGLDDTPNTRLRQRFSSAVESN